MLHYSEHRGGLGGRKPSTSLTEHWYFDRRFWPNTTLWLLSKHLKPEASSSCPRLLLTHVSGKQHGRVTFPFCCPDFCFTSWAAKTCKEKFTAGPGLMLVFVFNCSAKQCWATTQLVLMAKHHTAQRPLALSQGSIMSLCYCKDRPLLAGCSATVALVRGQFLKAFIHIPDRACKQLWPVTEAYQGHL